MTVLGEQHGSKAAGPGGGAQLADAALLDRIPAESVAKLRLGVRFDADQISGWRKIVLQRVLDDHALDVALIIQDTSGEPDRPSLFARARRTLWGAVDAVEGRLVRRLMHGVLARANGFSPSRLAQSSVRVADLSAKIPRARGDDMGAIRAADLDLVLDLTRRNRRDSAEGTRWGSWSLRTACGRDDAASPLGFWEFFRDKAITEVSIVASRPGETRDAILASAHYCTYRWSWSLNELLLGLKASWLLLDTLHRIQGGKGPSPVGQIADQDATALGGSDRERGLLAAPALVAKYTARMTGKVLHQSLFEDHWRLLLMEATEHGDVLAGPLILKPPRDRYWADPFVMRRKGKCFVFFEEYPYATGRGVISYLELDDLDRARGFEMPESQCVIDQPYHLSYPFLFTHQGDTFMIPESSANKSIDVWRAADFPRGWKKHKTLFQGVSATDTSLLQWNGKWWLFTNIDRNGMNDHRNELHIFYADDPIAGEWHAHPLNPVLIDARRARMAGGFLKGPDGRPVRCGQVQSKRYGEAVAYCAVSELSETSYAETPMPGFNPVPITKGARTHHVAYRDGMLVADECLIANKLARRFGRN